MALKDYVPDSDAEFCNLLNHITATLPQYYAALGITAITPQVVTLTADTVAFAYLCERQTTLSQAGQASTRERNRARYGDKDSPNVSVDLSYPSAPASVPSPIMPGVETRLRNFTGWLRKLPAYQDAIGESLHLVGEDSTPADPSSLQPTFKLRLNGGKVEILWGWGSAAGVAKALYIEVDRGTGPQFLVTDSNPNYTDFTPLPATPQKWRYRAIWYRDGEMLGQWSPWVEITVSA